MSVLLLLVCGLAWNYSTHRYLKGFADAIFPLDGSPQEKTEGLLKWLRDGPHRASAPRAGLLSFSDRDAVDIVQNARLLRICGSASNAFINLADVADLRTRRLLLLTRFGGTMHVVAEVQWGERWVVVDPTFARVLEDRSGRALTKEELRDPEVFRDAISRIPGYSPTYTFERTTHLHLERLPLLGVPLRRTLDRVWPGWEEAVDWGYVPENPSLWPILASLPLLLLGSLIRLIVERYRSADSTNYADYPLTQSAKSVEDRSA
jgi:hypothetical protein